MIRHLFVPGLLGPVPPLAGVEWPAMPRLETLLARADRLHEPVGYAAGLFALFGIDMPGDADLPTAAVSFLAESGASPAGFVLHADPLQLIADRDCLLAFDLDDDPLAADEVDQLTQAFNAHFGADGLRLLGVPSGSVYLDCAQPPSIRTQPLSAVVGRNVDRFLPDGGDRRRWRGLLNETQMLCHGLELNRARESQGRPVLGGLWFSGGGRLPSGGRDAVVRLTGECPLARGLVALQAGTGGDELLVDHAPRRAVMRADCTAWLCALEDIERRLAGLLSGCDELQVHTGNGTVFRWHARAARRWWRRRRPLAGVVDTGPQTAPGHGSGETV